MPLPREPGCGPGATSIRRKETPLRASSQASVSPVGPAPTISTVKGFRSCWDSFASASARVFSFVRSTLIVPIPNQEFYDSPIVWRVECRKQSGGRCEGGMEALGSLAIVGTAWMTDDKLTSQDESVLDA
jgi:hypothetical protein